MKYLNILLWLVLVLASSATRVSAQCEFGLFTDTFSESSAWSEILRIKKTYGFVPHDYEERLLAAQKEIEGNRHAAYAKFFRSLHDLSRNTNTLMLIYGHADGSNCVWLIDETRVLAAERTEKYDTWFLQSLWDGLDVVSRSANRTRRSSSATNQCPPHSPQSESAIPPVTTEALAALREASRRLLPLSIASALAHRPGGERLLILPYGDLAKVPFAALPLSDANMVDKFAIVVLESIRSLQPLAEGDIAFAQIKPSELLVVGAPDLSGDPAWCWPDLPYAAQEARNAANKLGSVALIGQASNFDSVFALLNEGQDKLRLAYFATHGIADVENPADGSFLALSGSHLYGNKLRHLSFRRHPLVVMSACETGLGKVFAGGVFGLADAWYYSGASQIIMSLWDISDLGTSQLMAEFVEQLGSLDAAEKRYGPALGAEYALAEAMRRQKTTTSDPAIWAAFTVYGTPSR